MPETATLGPGPAGARAAVAAAGSRMTAWRLGAGVPGWTQFQQVRVTIPHGSSG
jgi:hypothetical protein